MTLVKEAHCPSCSHVQLCGPPQILAHLRSLGMLRREGEPAPEVLEQLFMGVTARLVCAECGHVGLQVSDAHDQWEDTDWLEPRDCDRCGQPIPAERLEVFPDTKRCVACQGKPDPQETEDYCPKCGAVMQVQAARSGGRYELKCPSCRFVAR